MNTTSGFPVGGNFILGQKMDDFTGIFEAEESFSGMITSFNVWDHLLNESSINSTVTCNCKTLHLLQTNNELFLKIEHSKKCFMSRLM